MSGTPARSRMGKREARACVEEINAHLAGARAEIERLYDGRGWEALGYPSWRTCVVAEFGQSQAHVYRQLAAARVEREISPMGEIGAIPERQLRPLARLLPDLQRAVWADVCEAAPDGKPTGRLAARAVSKALKEKELRAMAEKATGTAGADPDPPWEVRTGDCLEGLAALPPGAVRLVFADPPYNNGTAYGGHFDDARDPGVYRAWCREWFRLSARALTPDGTFWAVIDEPNLEDFLGHARLAGLHLRRLVTWYETFGSNVRGNFNATSRYLLYCVKDPDRFVWRPEAVNRPSDRQAKYNDARANPAGKNWDSVWTISRVCGTYAERVPLFPTQIPLAVTRAAVGCASDPGDLVVDPFSGSASTGVAAVQLGRRYLGFELSGEFATLSRGRLAVAATEVDSA